MSKPLLVTGSNGLVGSKFVGLYSDKFEIEKIDLSDPTNPVDITNISQVEKSLNESSAQFVVHFAAFTDVTAAWQQSEDKSGLAYKVNVEGTKNLAEVSAKTNKHLIHISTSYIFDGKKKQKYHEEDEPNPIEWYGQTKAWAEEVVQASSAAWTILRIDQPFRQDSFPKKDLVHTIASQLQNSTLPPQFVDHWFGPTVVEDFAQVINWVIETNTTGIYHASSGESWTNYDFALAIAQFIGKEKVVQKGSLNEYLKTTNRPYQVNTALDCSKLFSELNFSPTPVKKALEAVDYSSLS